MRITIIGLNYAPEVTGIAPYTTGLAEGLAARGHDVGVVAGLPHYPQWRRQSGAAPGPAGAPNGVGLRRVGHHVPRRPAAAARVRMETGFGVRATAASWHRPDVVITVSPALLAASAVVGRARAAGVPVGLVVQDLYGVGARETGMGAVPAAALGRLERAAIDAATGTVVVHERFAERLAAAGVRRPERITVIRNWSHIDGVVGDTGADRAAVRARFGWRPDEVVVLHSGNMGVKQGLENVVDAARLAERRGDAVRLVLLGDGGRRPELEAAGRGASRLQFLDPLPAGEYEAALAAADVLLVNEAVGVSDMAAPSKLTSYFAGGRPVLAATAPDGVTAGEMRRAGAGDVVPAGDPTALLDGALALAHDHDRALSCGDAARRYVRQTLGAATSLDRYERWCDGLVGAR